MKPPVDPVFVVLIAGLGFCFAIIGGVIIGTMLCSIKSGRHMFGSAPPPMPPYKFNDEKAGME